MSEQNQNILNEEYDAKMTLKYQGKIKDSSLQIGDWRGVDPEVTNIRFLEKFNIKNLNLNIDSKTNIQFKNGAIKELNLCLVHRGRRDEVLKMNVDDLELENLEVLLVLNSPNLQNDQLYNLAKFKKLHTLDVSNNNVDLTHIHKAISLTKLSMYFCYLQNIDKISSLTNLMILNISNNLLQNINSIRYLVSLKELNINSNKQIDITPLKDLNCLIKLDMSRCGLRQLSALKYLINLQILDLSDNSDIIITELQFLKNLTHLNLDQCNIVSIYVLRPLANLEELSMTCNNIVYLDANLNEMKNLKELKVQYNLVSDTSSIYKHQNFDNLIKDGARNINLSYQRYQKDPSEEELQIANQFRNVESPNIQLKEIQNKSIKTTLNNCKQEINVVMNRMCSNHVQFTSNVVHFFQQLNQFGFE